jgi:hypothetical protein
MATKTISLRLTPENHEALKTLAKANGMTVHAVIHSLISEACEEHGIYWKPPVIGRPKESKRGA